jgi:hypothetical protein
MAVSHHVENITIIDAACFFGGFFFGRGRRVDTGAHARSLRDARPGKQKTLSPEKKLRRKYFFLHFSKEY